jgi:ABC-type uncharacterized transport system auxiliary subunit
MVGSVKQKDRIIVQSTLGKKQDSISKITRAKWSGGMNQMVEHLLSKCKDLSSNSSTVKRKCNWLLSFAEFSISRTRAEPLHFEPIPM